MNPNELFQQIMSGGHQCPTGTPSKFHQALQKLKHGLELDDREKEDLSKGHDEHNMRYAKMRFNQYENFKKAGFTDNQAFELILAMEGCAD